MSGEEWISVAKKHTHDKQRLPRSCNAAEVSYVIDTGARTAPKFTVSADVT